MWKLLTVTLAILAFSKSESEKVTVGIVHYNDVYGQLFPFKRNSDPPQMCSDNDEDCTGGIRELAGHIRDIRTTFRNLDAEFVIATGNLISGDNGWLTYLNEDSSWSEHGDLLRNKFYAFDDNYYMPNFTTLGPREFDGGVSLLNTYLGYGTSRMTRVLVSNLNCENVKLKEEQGLCSLVDSFQIINVGNFKIGLIGFVDPKVVHTADPGTLQFENTINSLKSVVEYYLSDVNVVIAIGSGSLELVKSIVDEIERVQLVIYANGDDKDKDQSTYPLHYNGKYIAKAGMYGSSVGKLVLDIETATGKIALSDREISKLVEVNNSTKPDDYWKSEFESFRRAIKDDYSNKIISRTKVTIDGLKENCWTGECTLGDLVADSMVNCVFQNSSINVPADLIALWHSGGLGNVQIQSGDNISITDAYKLLPYSSKATLVTITGKTLKKMFNQSATALDDSFKWGQFLQVSSGVQVHYTVENGATIVSSLKTVKMENDQLKYTPVEDASLYYVVIPSALYNGHNAYWDLPGSFISGGGFDDHTVIGAAHTCLKNFLQKMGAMKLGVQKRIFID